MEFFFWFMGLIAVLGGVYFAYENGKRDGYNSAYHEGYNKAKGELPPPPKRRQGYAVIITPIVPDVTEEEIENARKVVFETIKRARNKGFCAMYSNNRFKIEIHYV